MPPRIPLPSDKVTELGIPDTTGLNPALDAIRQRTRIPRDAFCHVDPVTAELVRMRNARHQNCQLCQGLRSEQALASGVTDDLLALVDDFESSELPVAQKLALRLAEAFLLDPGRLDENLRAELLEHLGPEQIVELIVRLIGWSANKRMITLGLDLAEIRPQTY